MIEYNLNFMHPQYGTIFNVDIDGAFTVEEMIKNLLHSGFIPANDAGYDLALGEQILDRSAFFEQIETLEDGDVIRIIAHQKTDIQPKETVVMCFIQHPDHPIIKEWAIMPNAPLSVALDKLADKYFIEKDIERYQLSLDGSNPFDTSQSLEQLGLKSGTFFKLIDTKAVEQPPISSYFEPLQQKLTESHTQIEARLKSIEENMPSPSLIPIDVDKAVNPTMAPYESFDTLISSVRQEGELEPIRKIRIFSWIPAILFFLVVAIGVTVGILWPQIIALFQ